MAAPRSGGWFRALLGLSLLLTAACGEPALAPPRHVVIVSLDAVGAKHVGAYGYDRDTTPSLDALAREGALFERAYSPQVWTMTSHLTMLTGLHPKAHGAAKERRVAPGAPALASLLKERGFATAAFTSGSPYAGPRFGLGRGFDRFRLAGRGAAADNEARYRWLEGQAIRARKDPEHRFFLFAHYYGAHSDVKTEVPYDSPPEYRLRYLPGGLRWDRRGDTSLLTGLQAAGDANDQDIETITALYDAGVRYVDEVGLGGLLAKLRDLGLDDETLVVVTSDHGEEMFEHGKVSHQQPYEEVARVPLVVRGPGVEAGARISQLTGLVDLVPTVLSMLEMPIPEVVQGTDRSDLLRGEPGDASDGEAFVDGIFGAAPPYLASHQSAVIADLNGSAWSYIVTLEPDESRGARRFESRGDAELYLLDEDPAQETNVASRHPEVAAHLHRRLVGWFDRNEEAARSLGAQDAPPVDVSERDRERLRALGYAQ